MDFSAKLMQVYQRFSVESPFYFEFLQRCRFHRDSSQKSLIRMELQGTTVLIYYQPDKWKALSYDDLAIQIEHQILHLILAHSVRGDFTNKQYFHIACDMIINNAIKRVRANYSYILNSENKHFMHQAPLLPLMYEHEEFSKKYSNEWSINGLTAECLYNFLDKVKDQWQPDCEPTDTLHFKITKEEKDSIKKLCADISVKIGSIRYGLDPAFERMVVSLSQAAHRDYRQVVKTFVGKIRQENKKNWSRVNRRYPNQVAGKSRDNLPILCVIIDTSGSMFTESVFRQITKELNALKRTVKAVHVVAGDTELKYAGHFKNKLHVEEINFVGSGGTDLQFGWDYAKAHNCDGVICYTDGHIGEIIDHGIKSFFVLARIDNEGDQKSFRNYPAAIMEIDQW